MVCQKREFQEFCAKACQDIPCCEEIDRESLFNNYFPGNDPDELQLTLQLFELRDVLLQKKITQYRARGICMYPCVRPGDVLCIEPKQAGQIMIGDIAVYRRSNRLFAHRVTAKGNNHGAVYIVTKPDNSARSGHDGPSFDQDILGVVSCIERRGKILDTARKEQSGLKRIGFGFILKCAYLRQYLFSKLLSLVNYAQQFKIYRIITGLFLWPNKKITFSIRVPLSIKSADRLNKEISAQELIDSNLSKDKNSISQWKIALNVDSQTAASLTFISRPETCPFSGWWVAEANTKVRYRGTRIEEALFAKAKQLLSQSGISRVYACVLKGTYFERVFLNQFLFKESSHYEDSLLKRKDHAPLARAIVERAI